MVYHDLRKVDLLLPGQMHTNSIHTTCCVNISHSDFTNHLPSRDLHYRYAKSSIVGAAHLISQKKCNMSNPTLLAVYK